MKAVLDHIGIAVRDLNAALAFYRDALGLEIEAPEDVISQRVRAHFVPVGNASLELLEAMKADAKFKRIPVVLVTTEGSDEQTQRGLDAGAAAYVKKPFRNEELIAVVQRLTGPAA